MSKKQERKARQAAKAAPQAAAEQTPAAQVQAKAARVVDPQVAKAQEELAKAKAAAKAAEAAAKEQRKTERARVAAERKAAQAEPRPTCTELKKDGSKCTSKAMQGKPTCVDHQPAWDRLTHEEHQAFGQWLQQARGPEIVTEIGWYRAKQIAKEWQGVNVANTSTPRPAGTAVAVA